MTNPSFNLVLFHSQSFFDSFNPFWNSRYKSARVWFWGWLFVYLWRWDVRWVCNMIILGVAAVSVVARSSTDVSCISLKEFKMLWRLKFIYIKYSNIKVSFYKDKFLFSNLQLFPDSVSWYNNNLPDIMCILLLFSPSWDVLLLYSL